MGDDEEIHGFFALVQDVTDRKRVEEERRVIDARLQETQKLESLGLLAGGIAHDFNNMLTGIMGNSGLVRMELPAESPLMQNLHDIETTARSLSDFCKQMPAYSGKGRFLLQTLNPNGIIEDMIQMLQHRRISTKAVRDRGVEAGGEAATGAGVKPPHSGQEFCHLPYPANRDII